MPVLPPTAAQIYDRLAASFQQAHAHSAVDDLMLQIGGCVAQLRATSPALRRQLQRPMACPQLAADAAGDFAIDLVDLGDETLPPLPWLPQNTSPEQQTSEYVDGPFVFTRHGDVLLTVFNQETSRTVGLVHAPARWPLRHYRQALFITLYQQLRRRGFHLIHASAIGYQGRVALVTGRSGAGKTTTMLTCVAAGFQFFGDDSTLLQRAPDGTAEVIALLNTLDVTDKTAAWFPELTPHLSPQRGHTGKRQVFLSEVYPGSIGAKGHVAAILAPAVADRADTSIAPVGKTSLLSDLLFYSVDLHDVALTRQHLEFLAQTIERTPCYTLLLGRDRPQIPRVLAGLLRHEGALNLGAAV